MTTKIPVELSSTPGIADSSNATAITIDSSEIVSFSNKVGIGTTSPDVTFEIEDTNAYMHIDATNHAAVFIDRASTSYHNNIFYQTAGTTNWRLGQMGADDILQVRDEINDNSNVMVWKHGGNVGIGTSSPDAILETSASATGNTVGALLTNTNQSGTADSVSLNFGLGRTADSYIFSVPAIKLLKEQQFTGTGSTVDAALVFNTISNESVSERMRINSSGSVLLGDGANEDITYTAANKLIMHHGHAFGNIGISLSCGAYTTSYELMRFYNGNGQVGDIAVSGSATDFDTNSDYRLKENVTYDWDATTRLKQLKPARFNWIADETNTLLDGFLAHEVSDIVPNAINGEKDAVYTAQDEANGLGKEGEPNMQGIDHSKLVPLLVKTIQELEARITTLEGE